ncbi:MAG: transglutaminase domain-containing protein [Clostridia bacterium]|nr:transglutaminase domain-containing protein [Clostridia bacterium]
MKRTQFINIIGSLLLASLFILSVVLIAILSSDGIGRLVVASGSAQKEYDGSPLVAHSYEILSGKLKNGHAIRASFWGSQTEIGTSENTFTIRIVDSSENDVTGEYEIELVFGKLNVSRESEQSEEVDRGNNGAHVSVGGGSTVDFGGRISAPGTGAKNELCLRVKNEINDKVYLKVKSFGAYTGTSWEEATEYNELIEGGFSASYLSSFAIENDEFQMEINSFSDQYFLPYYMSCSNFENFNKQTSDVLYSGDTEVPYSVGYSKFDYKKAVAVPYTLLAYERNYRTFVRSQYLEIDDETREYMEKIIAANNFYGNELKYNLKTVLKVAEYIQNSAQYSLNYNRKLDGEENIAVAFLDEYKEGICQHYASAATLLYRAMGIPARYTVGFVVNTKAGEWLDVKGNSAHAWVEVYIEKMGWVQIEVTSGFQSSTNDQQPQYFAAIAPVITEKQYDGTPLYAENRVSGFETYEAMGYTYTVAVNGSRTELGKGTSVIESFTVYNRFGEDVTKNFNIVYQTGTVHVYFSELIFTSEDATKVYDGLALATDISTCKMVGGTLRDGDNILLVSPLSILNASVAYADFDVTVLDEEGNLISDLYKITKNCGILTISPREITIKAADASKIYNGTALFKKSYTITEGTLAEGDFIGVCDVVGIQYEVGRSENLVKNVVILNPYGVAVTENYTIRLEPGVLQILPKP